MCAMPIGPLPVNLTGYCPYKQGLTARERLIEGAPIDARRNPLHTYEQHKADPTAHPYVSCAGDLTVWRYGQRVSFPSIDPDATFRVVDTGGHFHGPIWDVATQGEPPPVGKGTEYPSLKVIRVVGHEPIDVCVDDCSNHPGGFGAQMADVPDDGATSGVANAISSAFQSIGVDDPDVASILAVGVGLAFIGLGMLV